MKVIISCEMTTLTLLSWKDSNPRRVAPEATALSPERQMHIQLRLY